VASAKAFVAQRLRDPGDNAAAEEGRKDTPPGDEEDTKPTPIRRRLAGEREREVIVDRGREVIADRNGAHSRPVDRKEKVLISDVKVDRARWAPLADFNAWEVARREKLAPDRVASYLTSGPKSPQFAALQAELESLGPEISERAVLEATRRYLYGVVDVAGLRPEAICVEDSGGRKVWNDWEMLRGIRRVHFFARSATTPAQHYHRSFDGIAGEWTPWARLPVDVPEYTAEVGTRPASGCFLVPFVHRGRLILGLPRFARTTIAQSPDATKNSAADVSETWEIQFAYTELVDGAWRQVVVASDMIRDSSATTLPAISSYQFVPNLVGDGYSQPRKMNIEVLRAGEGVGSFNFDGRVVSVGGIPSPRPGKLVAAATVFQASKPVSHDGYTIESLQAREGKLMYPVAPTIVYTPAPPEQQAGHCAYFCLGPTAAVEVAPEKPAVDEDSVTEAKRPEESVDLADEIMMDFFDDNLFVRLATLASSPSAQSLEPLIAYLQNPPMQTPPEPVGAWKPDDIWGAPLQPHIPTLGAKSDAAVNPNSGEPNQPPPAYSPLRRPFSLYAWELALRLPLLAADLALAAAKPALALSFLSLVFDGSSMPGPHPPYWGADTDRPLPFPNSQHGPSPDPPPRNAGPWRFGPFAAAAAASAAATPESVLAALRRAGTDDAAPAAAGPASLAAVAVRWARAAVAEGDAQRKAGDRPGASRWYAAAEQVVGPVAEKKKFGKMQATQRPETYVSLLQRSEEVGSPMEALELEYPAVCRPRRRLWRGEGEGQRGIVGGLGVGTYFTVPEDEEAAAVRELVASRLREAGNGSGRD
jgi:hypothetical protein